MKRHSNILMFLAILACGFSSTAGAATPETRLALVIGNASYKTKALSTAVNDAALIAQTLQSAGFDVIGARDLDQGLLRGALSDFTNKIASAGKGAVVFVYFSGYGVQVAGENYLIPIGADISDVADLPARSQPVSELMHAVAALNPKSAFIVLDAARPGPFVLSGQAGGLAWTEPESNMLIAFSTAPGTLARDTVDGNGPYAKALAEMIREGDLTPANLFDRVRLRVHEQTKGAQIPWDASKIETQFKFFERTSSAPARADTPARTAQLRVQPMRALGAQNAYLTALLRDTFDAYTDFLADYWQDPMTKRVRALLAARRESITWQRTCQANEPFAYWSYLERYPLGPHVADARRLLAQMGAVTTLPSKFARMEYEVPPPLPDELEYVERPALILDDPELGFEPPPATPVNFLEPQPQELVNLKPVPALAPHALPVLSLPLQAFLRMPPDVRGSPDPSSGTREAWVMRPAIEVPSGPEKQTKSAPMPSVPISNAANGSTPFSGGQTRNGKTSSTVGNQDASIEIRPRLASPSAVVSETPPQWFTDIANNRNRGSVLRTSLTGGEATIPATSMFAPAAAGLTFVPSLQMTQETSAAAVRSPARQPSRTELPGEISTAAVHPRMIPPQSPPNSQTPPVAAIDNLSDPRASTSQLASPRRTSSTVPTWLTDMTTPNRRISSGLSSRDSEPPMSAPSMYAAASAGLTFQTWRYGIQSSRKILRASEPFARASAATRRGGSVEQTSSAATLSPRQTGSIPRSASRAAALAPAASGSNTNPRVDRAQPSSTTDQARLHKKRSTTKPVPSSEAADDVNRRPLPNPQ